MSEFFKMCLLQFYCPVDLRLGAQLQLHGQSDRAMIFCRVGVLLGDEGALKEVLEMKGAAGSKLCCLCSNLVDHKSGIAECDTTHTLVKSTELDVAKIQRHSDESNPPAHGFSVLGDKSFNSIRSTSVTKLCSQLAHVLKFWPP